jgi:hypothetical protein
MFADTYCNDNQPFFAGYFPSLEEARNWVKSEECWGMCTPNTSWISVDFFLSPRGRWETLEYS